MAEPTEAETPVQEDFQKLTEKLAEFASAKTTAHPFDEPTPELEPEPDTGAAPVPAVQAAPVIPAPAPEPKPAVLGHPLVVLNAARDLGIDEAHLAPGAVATPALIDIIVKMQQFQAARAEAPKQTAPAEDDADWKYLEEDVGFDKKALAILKKQADEIKQLKSRPDPEEMVRRALAQRDTVTAGNSAVDSAITSLGPKFEKVLGKGPLHELVDGPEKSVRLRLFASANIDFAKDSPAVIKQKYIAAANEIYGPLLADPAPEAPKAAAPAPAPGAKRFTQEDWDRAALSKPTAAKAKKSKGEQAAVEHIQEIFREHNYNGYGQEQMDGLPDNPL